MPLSLDLPRTLHYGRLLDPAAPLNRGSLQWHLALPKRMGTTRWLNLGREMHASLIGMSPSSATGGWAPTRRPGGWGEIRLNGTTGYASLGTSTSFDFANM